MYISPKYFKYFLTETATGLCYYLDAMGQVQKGNVALGKDFSLPEEPIGWIDNEIMYGRNGTYWGINRSFTVPLEFVGDGATILRTLFLTGRGIEQPVTLVILKWKDDEGYYKLYYKGQLDLSQNVNEVAVGFKCNVMEGGILQLLKAYENTVIEIPCDGSIPENIKVFADGILFNDTFHYQILKIASPYAGDQALPCVYLGNDGDNIGVIHGDQTLENTYTDYFSRSANFVYSSLTPGYVRIKGSISVMSDWRVPNTVFRMGARTSASQQRGVDSVDHAVGLVLPQSNPPEYIYTPDNGVTIDGQRTFSFDEVLYVGASENLFVTFFNDFAAFPLTILGGTFDLSFSSKLPSSRVWGITALDVWKLIGKKLNALASTSDQPFNYQFTSDLLTKYLRFVITSGDAARASTTPNYFQYFNQATLNPQNPNNQDYNQFAFQGPAIKISLADFFDSINVVLCAAIGNQKDNNGNDSIFLEERRYVMNPDVVSLTLPQVSNFRISVDLERYFNWLELGYSPNQYDETSCKFEYNNTNKYQAPVKMIAKVLQLISKIRTDSYGFEMTRYNTQGGKSTTFNNSDSSLWFLNTDFSQFVYDYYSAIFLSSIQNVLSTANTNLKLVVDQSYQQITYSTLDGEYFVNGNDFSIFMFNQPVPGSRSIAVSFSTLLNGLIGDSATIKMYINGVVAQSWTQAVTGTNTAFNGVYNATRVFNPGDNIYFTVDTIKTCTVNINDFSLNIGAGYFICTLGGAFTVSAGSTQQLIPLPVITAQIVVVDGKSIEVVSYGFQYFRFLSNIQDPSFDWSFAIAGFVQGDPGQKIAFNLWKNGVSLGRIEYNGNDAVTAFNPGNTIQFAGTDSYNNYDTFWVTADCQNLNAWVTQSELLFTSKSIKAYRLLRKLYKAVSGIPNPETAFNIEDFTPGRLLRQNGPMLRAILAMVGAGQLTFQTTDKNQFLSTTDENGITITENANIDLHDLGDYLWLPLIFDFDTEVPYTAKETFDYAANGHIKFPYKGKWFYGFPIQVTIKSAMNESQSWKLLASPLNSLPDMVNLDWDGITSLQLLDVMVPYICPLHFVPLDKPKDARYNTQTMDEDWYMNRIQDFIDKSNYLAPWQLNDIISLQCQTAGLSPVTIEILNELGQSTGIFYNLPANGTSAVLAPQTLYQGDIPLAGLAEGKYYFKWTMGTGAAQAILISEGIWVKSFWPKTQLFEYSHSRNKLAVIFNADVPYRPSMRAFSQIPANSYVSKSKFTTYLDEPQDITLLNGIPYDTWTLEVGNGNGLPDYFQRKIDRIFNLDTVLIDGVEYTREADAQIEVQTFPGQPKTYLKLNIRKAENVDGITVNTDQQIEGPQQAGYVLDADAFGTNGDNTQRLIIITNS